MRVASSGLVLVLVATTAAADSRKAADEAFQRGRELMKQKKFAEACASFEQSQRLDPQLGTLFNLADCEVELGKLATARSRFRELARNDPNPSRREVSAKLADKLDRRVPKLLVTIAAKPEGAQVMIDGVDSTQLVGVAQPVDLADYSIEVKAPGFRDWHETIGVHQERKTVTVKIRLEPIDAQEAPVREAPPPVDAANPRRRYATIAMISGGALVTGGLVVGAFAWREWNKAQCTTCSGADKRDYAHTAHVLGNVSTVTVILGLIPLAGGVYLWKTSNTSVTATPQVGSDHAGVTISGSF